MKKIDTRCDKCLSQCVKEYNENGGLDLYCYECDSYSKPIEK